MYNLAKRNDVKEIQKLDEKFISRIWEFTQIVFALKEKLSQKYEKDINDINNLFNSNKRKGKVTAVGEVNQLANMWKHKENIEIYNNYSIEIKNGISIFVNYEKRIADSGIPRKNNDRIIIILFKSCLKEIHTFCKEKNYI